MFLAYGFLYNSKHMKPKEEYSWNDCCLLSGSDCSTHAKDRHIHLVNQNYNVELG